MGEKFNFCLTIGEKLQGTEVELRPDGWQSGK